MFQCNLNHIPCNDICNKYDVSFLSLPTVSIHYFLIYFKKSKLCLKNVAAGKDKLFSVARVISLFIYIKHECSLSYNQWLLWKPSSLRILTTFVWLCYYCWFLIWVVVTCLITIYDMNWRIANLMSWGCVYRLTYFCRPEFQLYTTEHV